MNCNDSWVFYFCFLHSYVWLCTALFNPLSYSILFPHYSETRNFAMKRADFNDNKRIKTSQLYNLELQVKEYRILCDTGLYFRV